MDEYHLLLNGFTDVYQILCEGPLPLGLGIDGVGRAGAGAVRYPIWRTKAAIWGGVVTLTGRGWAQPAPRRAGEPRPVWWRSCPTPPEGKQNPPKAGFCLFYIKALRRSPPFGMV